MTISREDVLRVAELAHLELKPEEVEMYRGQLDGILNYIGKLQELDVTNAEPMSQVVKREGGNDESYPELREDTIRPCHVANEILSQAPDATKPFFRVPKVIDR